MSEKHMWRQTAAVNGAINRPDTLQLGGSLIFIRQSGHNLVGLGSGVHYDVITMLLPYNIDYYYRDYVIASCYNVITLQYWLLQ